MAETAEQRATILELDRYCAVIVVSKPAARLGIELLDKYWPQPPLGPAWFSVGAATGAILESYGLDVSWPERGDDSEALLALPRLDEALARPDPKVLILRGRVVASSWPRRCVGVACKWICSNSTGAACPITLR